MSADSPNKRKRGQELSIISTHSKQPTSYPQLKSDILLTEEVSPNAKVVGKLRRLGLDDNPPEFEDISESSQRKRVRLVNDDVSPSSSPTPAPSSEVMDASEKVAYTSSEPERSEPLSKVFLTEGRPNSPGLIGEVNVFFWQDSEITGHDPDDPMDDGYGINGIGFRPTPAIANQREQRRKQQLESYKNREARDARQRRSERRRSTFTGTPSGGTNVTDDEQRRGKVRFDDGS